MNKILIFAILTFGFLKSYSQTITYTPQTAAGYQYKYIKIDSGLSIPLIDTSLRRGVNKIGAIVARPQDSLLYYWTGAKWSKVNADVSGLLSLINQKVDSVTVYGDELKYWKNGVSTLYNLSTIAGTLNSVTTNGNTTANTISVGKLISGSDVEVVQATLSDVLFKLVTYFGPTIGVPNRSYIRGDSISNDNEYYLPDTSGMFITSVNGVMPNKKGQITIPITGGSSFDTTTIYNELNKRWNVNGNSGTTAGTNFIGTVDDVGIMFKVNNTQSGYIDKIKNNTSIGYSSMLNNSTGNSNTAFGRLSLNANTSGNSNTAIGDQSLANNTTGINNTFLGYNSGATITTGSNNAGLGSGALLLLSSGSSNIALGNTAGRRLTDESFRLIVSSVGHLNKQEDTTKSIIYGYQDANASNQRLYLNSQLFNPYISAQSNIGDSMVVVLPSTGKFGYRAIPTGGSGLTYPYTTNKYLDGYGNFSTLNTDSITQGSTNKFSQWVTSGSEISYSGNIAKVGTGTMVYPSTKGFSSFSSSGSNGLNLTNSGSTGYMQILLAESVTGANYGGFFKWNSAYGGNYTGTSLPIANSFQIQAGGSNNQNVVVSSSTIIHNVGVSSTSAAIRSDANGLRIGRNSNIHNANTVQLEVEGTSILNGNVGMGTSSPNSSALLDISSTTKGFLPPRMTTSQINAISSPAVGLVVYNTDLSTLCFYDGAGWRKVSHSAM